MESNKVIKLAKKLSKRANIKFQKTYDYFKNSHLFELISEMSANDVIYLVIISSLIKRGVDIDKIDVFNYIQSKIFIFSTIEKNSNEVDETCGDCGGSGEVNCGDCGGTGKIECEDCGGDGEDSDGYTCDRCDGDGDFECQSCSNGYVSCDTCDGNGEIENYEMSRITQQLLVSIDEKLFSLLELEVEEILSYEMLEKIKNEDTFVFNFDDVEVSNDGLIDNMSVGDVALYELIQNPYFYGEGDKIYSDLTNL